MEVSQPRVTLVSAGQLCTCPRMVKVADALHEEGYLVRAVTNRRTEWGVACDLGISKERPWLSMQTVDARREAGSGAFLPSAVRYHAARRVTRTIGIGPSGTKLRALAWLLSGAELLAAVRSTPADFFYFCGGSFPLARFVAGPYAVDFEDFHRGEPDDSADGRWESELTASLERDVAGNARFVTMASPLIAAEYRKYIGISGVVVHNVFPLPVTPPKFENPSGPLKVYWFSQTIGPGRGLEEAIRGAGSSGVATELHLRGAVAGYRGELERLARETAPDLKLEFHEPRPPSEMVARCRAFDIGLASEPGLTPNSRVLLSNKVFTYMLAGLAVAFSDTPAQREFRNALGNTQALGTLADALRHWDADRGALVGAKRDAWAWAKRRWHWEHPEERGTIARAFAEHVPKAVRCA